MNSGKEREMKDRYCSQLGSLEEENERACTRLDMVHGHGLARPCLLLFLVVAIVVSWHTHPPWRKTRNMCVCGVDDINRSKAHQREEEEEEANDELKDRGLWDPCHYTCSMLEREMMISKGNCIGIYSFQRRQP